MHRAIHVPLFRPAVLLLAMSLVLTYSPGCRPKDQPVAVLKVAVSLTQVAEGTVLPGVGEQILPGQESRVSVPEVVLDFRFTEPVVPDSISAALRLNPSVQHQISWPSPDMMQLRLSALPLGIPVSVTLGQEVRAVSGSTVPSPLTYRVVRQNPPAISATVEGQPELIAPGRYKVLAGKKTIRLDFDRPMDRTRVETSLLGQLPASCLPTLRWESDSVAYLDLDLALNTSVHLSFRGWPDRQGILSVGPGDMTLVAVSTVRLLAGISPQNPTQLSTLLDQFSAGFVSPDGKSIAFTERFPVDEASEVVVWTLTLADKTIRRLGSYTDTGCFRLGWMPDSRHLAINAGPEIRLVATSPTARPGQGSTQTASRTLVSLEDRTFVGMSIGPRSGRIAAFAPTNGEEGAAVDLLLIEPDGANVKNHPAVSHLFS
ncbi:MAG TPA: hypothetical protein GX513_14955, partial [Firmicutes bacterium]|nr:hypothetical protein [Bacillota bacterium]